MSDTDDSGLFGGSVDRSRLEEMKAAAGDDPGPTTPRLPRCRPRSTRSTRPRPPPRRPGMRLWPPSRPPAEGDEEVEYTRAPSRTGRG